MPRSTKQAQANAEAKPDAPQVTHYRANVYHEIEDGDGVIRVEPGFIVVANGGIVSVFPPEVYAERYPKEDIAAIAEQE
jgi:hypothetical protein